MDTDDLEPIVPQGGNPDLEEMSIAAIEEYIEGLKAEIMRAETAIERKKAARIGAESVFKS